MKKLLILSTILLGMNTLGTSQDDDSKSFRFGLKGDLSLNWLNPDNKKELLNDGVGLGYSWGLQLEFKLNKTISINTGLNLSTMSYKLNYKDATSAGLSYYVLNANEEFVDISNNTKGQYDTATTTRFQLNNRNFKANYVNIPVLLKMKTSEIGYLTYFGEFGANINVLVKSKVNKDDVLLGAQGTTAAIKEDLDMTKSTGLFNMGLRVGGGAEYNFSGSTSMFFALHYNHYFLNTLRSNDKYLQKPDLLSTTGDFKSAGQKASPGAVTLTVGILF